jgi:two-component system chemotaxis sensor kinase CheA
VVDDSITTRSLEKNVLEASGYNVRVAVDGLEALEKISTERPSLVISDIEMPRMTGLQLLEAMRANKEMRDIPVIIVSSLEKAEEKARCAALGADAYIAKRKFNQRELLDAIGRIL